MTLSQRLDLRQSQSLVMTPQLQQAIKLLQYSHMELAEFVEQEMERNPLLDRGDPDTGRLDDAGAGEPAPLVDTGAVAAAGPGDSIGVDRLTSQDSLAPDRDAPLDADFDNVYTGQSASDASEAMTGEDYAGSSLAGWGAGGGGRGFEDDDFGLEQRVSETPSLRDHVLGQVQMSFADAGDRLIAATLAEGLDAAGYLDADLDAVAGRLGVGRGPVEGVLARLQRLEPTGLFARSLSECLALQLAERDRLDPAMATLLDNLELLAKRDFAKLGRLCGVDMEDIADMVAEIRSLNPKPAAGFEHEVAQTLVPDILMRADPAGGGWQIELNPETLPRVLVNRSYHAQVSRTAKTKADKEFIAEAYANASWLVKSLHQRATTILKVAGEIVRQQDAFFVKGVAHLKPLILRNIAEAIDMHESTVSRVTSNKFIATPRGVFELKYFFTAAIQGADGGDAHSSEAVRHRIRALIDREAPKSVLSDDKIVEILKADGIDIARRTVAKYREAMGIPSSVQRRREKAMIAGA